MCGRVTLTLDKELIMEILNEVYEVNNEPALPMVPNYNMAPSNQLLSVISTGEARRAGLLTWGFVPKWTKEGAISHGLINARSETVDVKPTFRDAFESRRCIILADRFYEWKREAVKRPFVFGLCDQPLMPLAGVYTIYTKSDGTKLSSCAVLTCAPNEIMKPIHNRMPVILTPEAVDPWLSRHTSKDILKSLMIPYPSGFMATYEVSDYVNSVKNNGTRCVAPVSSVS